MQLVWAQNVVEHTSGNVLILAPLGVSAQTVREGEKFGIKVGRSQTGVIEEKITVTNYERLGYWSPSDFAGVVCDESSILKNVDGKTRHLVTSFLRKIRYRWLGTATPAPNDYMELGTSAEALGVMKYHQMLAMFFVNDGMDTSHWRLKGHAKRKFWYWVSTWARAIRKPSDLGFDDGKFILPPLRIMEHVVKSPAPKFGFMPVAAKTLENQRKERKRTIRERCELVASLVPKDRPFVSWCQLNDEGDLLEELIPGAVQVSGSDGVDVKEGRLNDFSLGNVQRLVTKPKIAGFGLNWQHCSDVSFFPTHSFEQWYQAVRRCWRFGQKREVTVNTVSSEAESLVLSNMKRKEMDSQGMYNGIIRDMREFQIGNAGSHGDSVDMELPRWLK